MHSAAGRNASIDHQVGGQLPARCLELGRGNLCLLRHNRPILGAGEGRPATRILEHGHIEHPSILELSDKRRAYMYQAVDPGANGHAIYIQVAGDTERRLVDRRRDYLCGKSRAKLRYLLEILQRRRGKTAGGHARRREGSGLVVQKPPLMPSLQNLSKPFKSFQKISSWCVIHPKIIEY